MTALRLGPLILTRPIGQGAAGVVYGGLHAEQRVPVAVKVIPPVSGGGTALRVLRNEVFAVARLDHPHVIMVLDHGEVPADIAEQSEGKLVAGSPYLVMELASGGSLDRIRVPCPWATLFDTLIALLDALAHAHARGVVHRDLKPGNVLLCTEADMRPGLKLTDFGLAQGLLPEGIGDGLHGGTPLFMAPEQFKRGSRDIGPTSDLYALGCLAFWMATGKPPFVATTWDALKRAHRRDPPPPLPPDLVGPPGFARWMLRLLEKDPDARFPCAADAAFALRGLEPERALPASDRLPPQLLPHAVSTEGAPTEGQDVWAESEDAAPGVGPTAVTVVSTGGARGRPAAPLSALPTLLFDVTPELVFAGGGARAERPPVPRTWRAPSSLRPDHRLLGAGLGLYGLRTVPFVGREEERDLLWSLIGEASVDGTARAVVLDGPSGVGKSRLCEWLASRASEVGAAVSFRATFARIPGPADGLGRMVARHVRLWGLKPEEALERATRFCRGAEPDLVEPHEVCALAAMHDAPAAFSSAAERYTVLYRFLLAAAHGRPALLWLDDVQWSADAIDFARFVLEAESEVHAPVVVLLCANDVDLLGRDPETERLTQLTTTHGARRIHVGPLPNEEHAALIEMLLGLEGALADEVRQRTAGNPLFAVHLVGDWVERGLLEATRTGFSLKEGVVLDIPDELHRLWGRRLERALPEREPGQARVAIEVAAVLGPDVDDIEWREVCREARVPIRADALDRAVTRGLLVRRPGGFAFAHAMIRSSAERSAREGGRLEQLHLAAAEALKSLYGEDALGVSGRIGRHLVVAGRYAEALVPLESGAAALVDEGELLDAEVLLTEWERAVNALSQQENDPRTASGRLLKARLQERTGRPAEARALAERVAQEASARGDEKQAGAALLVVADALATLGALEDAADYYRRARRASEAALDHVGVGLAFLGLGHVMFYQGDREKAARRYRTAHQLFEQLGRPHDVAQCLWSLGYIAVWKGAYVEAAACFEGMLEIARNERDRASEANAVNGLGEVARRERRLEDAARYYREAIRISAKCGYFKRHTFRLNLAHTELALGHHDVAARMAEEAGIDIARSGDRIGACATRWVLAACAAHAGDFTAFDRRLEEAVALVRDETLVDDDLALTAEIAAEAARRAGAYDSARPAYLFAQKLYAQLGAKDRTEAIDRVLARLGTP